MTPNKVKKLNIPKKPGCYFFLDKDKVIIYVGKAVDLRSRVTSYWRDSTDHSPAKYSMLKLVESIKWLEVDSEIEALLLEANLIKKHHPEYNILMRDDKRFTYIKVSTEDKWPRVFMTRNLDQTGKYFGPFTSTEAVRETLKVLRKIWPFRSCQNLPKKACLYNRIGKCPGCCEELIDNKEYLKIVKQIILFLEGKKKKVVQEIEYEIQSLIKKTSEASEERMLRLKFQLINLNKVLDHSNIIGLTDKYASDVIELAKTLGLPKVPERIEGYDISNIFGKEAVGSMVVFSGGEADKGKYRKFKIKLSDREGDVWMLEEMLERRFVRLANNDSDWPCPDLIIIDGGKPQLNMALKVMKRFELAISILAISKGEGLRSSRALDKIFFPGEKKPLELPLASPALHLVKRVRDESHRFAIKYHRELRAKKFIKK